MKLAPGIKQVRTSKSRRPAMAKLLQFLERNHDHVAFAVSILLVAAILWSLQ